MYLELARFKALDIHLKNNQIHKIFTDYNISQALANIYTPQWFNFSGQITKEVKKKKEFHFNNS